MRYIVNSLLVALCIPQLLFANTFLGQLDQSSDKNTGDFNTGLLNANPIQERPPIPEYEFEGGKSFDGPIASTNEDTPTKAVEEKGPKALTSIKVGGSIPVGIIGEYEYLFAPDFGVSVFVEGGGIALSVPSSDSGDIDVMNLNGGIGFRKFY